MSEILNRIKSIEIEHFRGFTGTSRKIETDGDIVLVQGPNGCGKTSLIDALCLVLNGEYDDQDRGTPISHGCDQAQIAINYDYILNNENKLNDYRCKLIKSTNGKSWAIEGGSAPWHLDRADFDWPEFMARCSFFYQDMLDKIIRELGEGQSIIESILPKPSYQDDIDKVLKNISKNLGELKKSYSLIYKQGSENSLLVERKRLAAAFFAKWREVEQASGEEADVLLPAAEFDEETKLINEIEKLAKHWKKEIGLVDIPGPDRDLYHWLGVVSKLCDHLLEKEIKKTAQAGGEDDFWPQIPQSLEEMQLIAADDMVSTSSGLAKLYRRRDKIKADSDNILACLKALSGESADDGGLDKWLAVLKENGTRWQEAIQNNAQNLPSGLVDWLKTIIASFHPSWADDMANWLSNQHENYLRVLSEYKTLVATADSKEKQLKFSQAFYYWLQNSNTSAASILKKYIVSQPEATFGELKKIVLNSLNSEVNNEIEKIKQLFAEVKKTIADWQKTESDIRRLREEAKKLPLYQQLEAMGKLINREAGRSKTNEAKWKQCYDFLSNEDLEKLNVKINEFFGIFRLPPELHPLQLTFARNGAKIGALFKIKDDREFKTFSTGQKAQAAIALMLALNYAFAYKNKHRILAFDDITTACDMSQMPRFAILLRKIAYTKDPFLKRQVFVVSHHEDMSDRLVDFLTPPHGYTLRIIRFHDWNKENGPSVSSYTTAVAKSATEDQIEKLVNSLQRRAKLDNF